MNENKKQNNKEQFAHDVQCFDVPQYLNSKGISYKQTSKGFIFKSPFREDKNASSIIFTDSKVYKDLGEDTAMSLFNLIKNLEKCDDYTAYKIIKDNYNPVSIPLHQTPHKATPTITKIFECSLQNKTLIQYLTEVRKISIENAQSHGVREIHYTLYENRSKLYFGIFFPNDKGGGAIRNAKDDQYKFKANYECSGITTKINFSDTAVIFEGFMDYLSGEEYWHTKTGKYIPYDIIILNSVTNRRFINLKPYKQIKCFLDNDKGGNECFAKILNDYPQAQNLSATLYPNYKDFNEFWINTTNK